MIEQLKSRCDAEADEVRELGGLFICGTERHESRRIDNQLRGRSGRQGDPGESRFFLSAEDDLIRLFAGERIYKILDRLGPVNEEGEEEALEAKMLTRTIENAQKKVEEQNFLIRKRVLEYDDVMNEQRRVVYKYRREILEGKDMSDSAREGVGEVVSSLVDDYTPGDVIEDWDLGELQTQVQQLWPSTVDVSGMQTGARSTARTCASSSWRTRSPPTTAASRSSATRSCASSSGRSCCRSSTTAGASTSTRWTTCARGSTSAASPRSIRWSPTRTRASRCSRRSCTRSGRSSRA